MRYVFCAVQLLALLFGLAGPGEAVSCAGVSDVTALSSAGCDFGGLTFSSFQVSASAGFDAVTVGIGTGSSATPQSANLNFQLAVPGVGPGDVLLAYSVAGTGLSGVDLTNNAIKEPVTIGELVCRVPTGLSGSCSPTDRLASLVAGPGEHVQAAFAALVASAFFKKDIALGSGGFITDFTNSHEHTPPAPVPEPATMLLLGSALSMTAYVARRRRRDE